MTEHIPAQPDPDPAGLPAAETANPFAPSDGEHRSLPAPAGGDRPSARPRGQRQDGEADRTDGTGRRGRRRPARAERPVELPHDLHFPPVVNGLDFLASAVRHLPQNQVGNEHRDLKYGLLHLQAASEVLLKARLEHEHWTLVIDRVGEKKVTAANFIKGDFSSVTPAEAVRRLRDIVGTACIDEDDATRLDDLVKKRNSFQHYGLSDNQGELNTLAGDVLAILVRFLDTELLPRLKEKEKERIADDLATVRDGLKSIEAYVAARMQQIGTEITAAGDQAHRVVECPTCRQMALLVSHEDGADACLFCGQAWESSSETTEAYVDGVIGFSWHDIAQGGESPVHDCPYCDQDTLVRGAHTFTDPNETVDFCFNCAEPFTGLTNCIRCGELCALPDDEVMCNSCYRSLVESD
ncbi:hypothetical protein OG723_44640 (plasmid) [Streptomyces sp. NBC_01278]|uniref:hypothetical protein n=1 Tax=Streptomyces sp. NBC_01278 TaxID=2903809 RepID=UPI002E36F416|nr:hypothetical protein [Streptomyces sp. NBC_01278]